MLGRNDFMDKPLEDGRSVYEIEVRNRSNVFDVEVDADKVQSWQRPGAGPVPMTTNPISNFQTDAIMAGPLRSADLPTG
jgi:hypothetical protein